MPLTEEAVARVLAGRGYSTETAARYYQMFRRLEGVAGAFEIVGPGELSKGAVWELLKAADGQPGGWRGEAVKTVLDGGRGLLANTLSTDRKCIGWQRIAHAKCCAFCGMLASRGVVYRSARTAGFGRSYHRGCACSVEPVFSYRSKLPPSSRLWAERYEEAGSFEALQAAWRGK